MLPIRSSNTPVFGFITKTLIAALSLLIIYTFVDMTRAHLLRAQTTEESTPAPIDVWWPENNVTIGGEQPFKFVVPDRDISSYDAYWRVGDGQLNEMYDDQEGHPHKEAHVDLSGWTWNDDGPYEITFVTREKNGDTISEESVEFYVEHDDLSTGSDESNPSDVGESADEGPDPEESEDDSSEELDETDGSDVGLAQDDINIWWPVNGVQISGTQPLKGNVSDTDITEYEMYWSVNDGEWNEMDDDRDGYPHKQSSVDVSEWETNSSGEALVTFRIEDNDGNTFGEQVVSAQVDANEEAEENVDQEDTSEGDSSTADLVTDAEQEEVAESDNEEETSNTSEDDGSSSSDSGGHSLDHGEFYDDPNDVADRQADEWRSTRPDDAAKMDILAEQPVATWVGGWNGNVTEDVRSTVSNAVDQGTIPAFVVYNIPQRDCGQYSAGGAGSFEEYDAWVQDIARGIGSQEALVILEPDAVAGAGCLSGSDRANRMNALSDAIDTLESQPNTSVYLDAGNTNWHSPQEIASRLQEAGIENAHGFALNTSNFIATDENVSYGEQVSEELDGKHFVVDTSRNGRGAAPDNEWCNPEGRGLGEQPTLDTGNDLADAFLWVKMPGESDGSCNGAPGAGQWYPDYALELIENRAF